MNHTPATEQTAPIPSAAAVPITATPKPAREKKTPARNKKTKPFAGRHDDQRRATRRCDLERIALRGLKKFLEVGEALRELRDDRHYIDAGYKTFEQYAHKRFGLGRSHAYRYIDAADIQSLLSPNGDMLPSETVARALVPLKGDPENLKLAWSRAKQRIAPSGKDRALTASVVRAEVVRLVGPPTARKRSNGKTTVAPTPREPVLAQLCRLWDESIVAFIRDGTPVTRAMCDELADALNELRNSLTA